MLSMDVLLFQSEMVGAERKTACCECNEVFIRLELSSGWAPVVDFVFAFPNGQFLLSRGWSSKGWSVPSRFACPVLEQQLNDVIVLIFLSYMHRDSALVLRVDVRSRIKQQLNNLVVSLSRSGL